MACSHPIRLDRQTGTRVEEEEGEGEEEEDHDQHQVIRAHLDSNKIQ